MILLIGVIIIFASLAYYRVLHAQSIPVPVAATSTLETDSLEKAITIASETPYTLINEAFPDAPIMQHVMWAESQGSTTIKNPNSSAEGLFQILKSTWNNNKCMGNIDNAIDNINCARILYDDSKLGPWEASRSNWQKYL